MKIIRILLIIVGSLGILDVVLLSFNTNFNFGFIVVFILSLILLLYGIFYKTINSKSGFIKWLKFAIYGGFIFMASVITFVIVFSCFDNVSYKEDALIVLGAGVKGETVNLPLENRLKTAIEYHKKNENAIIIVSGGQGPQEDITEALAMERYLIKAGIPQNKIIKEEKSTTTHENFLFSKEILDNKFENYSVCFVTNNFHVYRANLLAHRIGLNTNHLHAPLQGYNMPINYVREFFAVIVALISTK